MAILGETTLTVEVPEVSVHFSEPATGRKITVTVVE